MSKNAVTEASNPLKTFAVVLEDGSQILVKPAPWAKLEDVELLQLEIVKAAYDAKFSLGTLFKGSNKRFWDNATKLAAILPVVGEEKPGFDPKQIQDLDDLCRIFVSASTARQLETGSVIPEGDNVLAPSEISRIHSINFLELLIQIEKMSDSSDS